jgi:isopentenyl phosphate kinase
MKDVVLVKLGGSLITNKSVPYSVRSDVLKRLAKELHEARGNQKIIVGHGGGSFPHVSAHKYRTNEGLINDESCRGFAEVQNDASKLNRIVVQALLDAGENAVSVQPSALCIARNGKIENFDTKVIEKLLEHDFLPVPFGDAALDNERGCCIISTEEIFTHLAKKLDVKRIILVGKVDGVFNGDPENKNSKLIPEITQKNYKEVKRHLSGSDATDVTGGMLNKVEKMAELSKKGIQISIINGLVPGNLKRSMLGENIGTIIK